MHRILILTHEFAPFRGGISSLAQGLATGAAGLGHETHVLAPAYHGGTAEWDAQQTYAITRFPGSTCSILSLDKLTKFAILCRREIAAQRPDIVHAVDPAAQMAMTALSRLRQAQDFFFTIHGTELLRYRRELFPGVWMRGAFERVAGVTAVSRKVYEILMGNHEIAPDKVFVSYPGVDSRWFETPPTDRNRVRAEWSARPDDFVLLTVARRVPDKGHWRVIEGVTRLPEALRQRTIYVVVGDGPADYAQALRARAGSGSVRLHLLGEAENARLVETCDAADVFVMLSEEQPKRLEGFGIVYVEAAARGLASLACDTGGVAEAVLDGKTGIVLPYYPTPEAVAQSLERLIEHGQSREAMGRRARERARDFTWHRHASEVYRRFGEMLGQRR
ncbi:MAG: glycosyltransferase family 4 protein [Gemmatimonadota bacterium]|nr:MAG: glycosyltransferase family 4 protein [Gemmatimonadota bacterium]